MNLCPACGRETAGGGSCPACARGTDGPARPARSEIVTLLLAILPGLCCIMGVGHLYVGRIARGVTILVASLAVVFTPFTVLQLLGGGAGPESPGTTLIMIAAGAVAGFVIFVWQIIDAMRTCVRYNRHLADHGAPPW